jgi:hypothetical protein
VAVDGVDAVEQRDLEARRLGLGVVAVDHRAPVREGVRPLRVGVASREQRAQVVGRDVRGRRQVLLVGLRHLPDLLVERHACQQRVDLLLVREERLLRGRHRG